MSKRKAPFFTLILFCLFSIILFKSSAAAENLPDNASESTQTFNPSGKLPQEIQKQLKERGDAEVIVMLEVGDIRSHADSLRKARRLKTDSREIIAEKARLYNQKKTAVLNAIAPFRHKVIREYPMLPLIYLRAGEKALLKLLETKEVRSVSEDKAVLPHLTESLLLINATDAHLAGATGSGTSVAVLDTGVDYTRSAFGSCTSPGVPSDTCRVIFAQDFADENADGIADDDGSLDDNGHGTNVSGIVAGTAPGADLIGLAVFRLNGYAYTSDILSALNWVLANRATYNIVAVNMSLGGGIYSAECPEYPLAPAITDLRDAGIASSISSGNSGYVYSMAGPACVPGAISVGAVYDSSFGSVSSTACTDATTAADQVACFSNSASFLTMLAPGAFINAAGITMGGTSQAAPHVAGAVAAIKSVESGLSVTEVLARMEATGVPVLDTKNSITKPRLDLGASASVSQPILVIEQSGFSFMGAEDGTNPASEVMDVINAGTGILNWSASNGGAGWLNLTPSSGTGSAQLGIDIDTASLTPGSYNTDITVTATGALNSPATVPVTLEIVDSAFVEDFETGDLTKFPWQTGGNGSWAVQSTTVRTGSFAAQSPAITHSQTSSLEATLNVTTPGYVYFWVKTSTELTYDKLKFYVNGVNEGPFNGWSGEVDWMLARSEHIVSPGLKTFKWIYSKDSSVSRGEDKVWIDDIFFAPVNLLTVSPVSKDFGNVDPGSQSSSQSFTVTNIGGANTTLGILLLSGTDSSEFVLQNDNCSSVELLPSGTCTLEAKFAPLSSGSKTASISVPSGDEATTTVSLTGTGGLKYKLSVIRNGTGTGSATSSPAGVDCGSDCTEYYADGTSVTLTPSAASDSVFMGWSGACTGTGSCILTMDADKTVYATFDRLPVAAFSASPILGGAPLSVSFTDASMHTPTSWAWDFNNDGITDSTSRNPVHVYDTPGTYTVSLTVTNTTGTDNETKTDYIDVKAVLAVNKDGSTGFGTVTSLPSGIDCGNDCNELYDAGTAVILTALADSNSEFSGWSGGGCSGTDTCEVTMTESQTVTAVFTILPPVADFSAAVPSGEPLSAAAFSESVLILGDAPLAVNFTDLSANNPSAWSWDFGVSGRSSEQNPLHTFRNAGVYTVALTVTNASGSDIETKNDYITVNPCANQPLRISGVDKGTSIQDAYDNNANETDIINIQALEFIEILTLDRPISITLAGGYNCDYSSAPSDTIISGLIIDNGTVTLEKVTIQ